MRKLILQIALLLSISKAGYSLQEIDKFVEYHKNYPIEKVYLHLDKQYYFEGETIYFSGYVVEGIYHTPSSISKSLKVELIDIASNNYEQVLLEIDSGRAKGHINLTNNYPPGHYQIRAYTDWMLNFDEKFIFTQDFLLLSSTDDNKPIVKAETNLNIQFYPEGGQLIDGIPSKIGFKIIEDNATTSNEKLKLFGEQYGFIQEISTPHFGLGSFLLTPNINEKYYLEIDGKKFYLPEIKKSGYTLSFLNSKQLNDVRFEVQSTMENPEQLTAIIHCRGLPLYHAKSNDGSAKFSGAILKSKLHYGINYLTIFDSNMEPILERMFFIEDDYKPQFDISVNGDPHEKRGLVELEIESKINDTIPFEGTFSVSVLSGSEMYFPHNENIESSFFLQSELEEKISNSGYYLSKSDSRIYEQLDVLMLTTSNVRYNWQNISRTPDLEIKYLPDEGLGLKGHINRGSKMRKNKKSLLSLMSPQNDNVFGLFETNNDGSFEITGLSFTDSLVVFLEGKDTKNNMTFEVVLDTNQHIPKLSKISSTEAEYDKILNSSSLFEKERLIKDVNLAFSKDVVKLDEVVVKGKKEESAQYFNAMGPSDAKIVVDNIPNAITFTHPLDLLSGRVAGVQVRRKTTGQGIVYEILIRGISSITAGTDPIILIDNVTASIDELATLPVEQIEAIEVYKSGSTAMLGARGTNGAIAFFTKTGSNTNTQNIHSKALMYVMKGYQNYINFNSPDYSDVSKSDVKPDLRRTLYWNPKIKSDDNGKIKFSFYTDDNPQGFLIIVQGMNNLGVFGHQLFTIE